jgi:hypothetical protein
MEEADEEALNFKHEILNEEEELTVEEGRKKS